MDEKVALVTEIDRRYRAGSGSLRAIASALGTTDTSYCNWIKAGIKPSQTTGSQDRPREYSLAEREKLVAEVTRLRADGQSLRSACDAAEVSPKSFRKWQAAVGFSPVLRPVEVTALVPMAPASAAMALVAPTSARAVETLTLVAPGGYRIEGLTIESAVALLRALA
jgi:hypothetical protein